jgi:hypothetical protein
MRSTVIASALCGLVAAAPRPQMIDLGALNDLPTPSVLGPEIAATTTPSVTYDPAIAVSSAAAAMSAAPASVVKHSANKRDICVKQPGG